MQQFWHRAPESLRQRKYHHDGCDIQVEVNWQPLANRLQRDFDLIRPFRKGVSSAGGISSKILKPLRIRANVTVSGENPRSGYQWYPTFFLKAWIHEIFLIANLSVPGAACFENLSIKQSKQSFPDEVRLSSFSFDAGWVDALDGEGSAVQALPREDVLQWFNAINVGYKQQAETGVERALYALLHMAGDDTKVDSITWLFYGLEALVSTRVGENISGLVRRLSSILDLEASQQKWLNKQLRQLYDMRSSFVHGGYAIPHPLANEVIDKHLDHHFSELFRLHQFGTSLLISTLQALIKKRIVGLRFDEQLITTTL